MADAQLVFAIDQEACVGHGRCYSVAPESFDADDDGYGIVLGRDERDRSKADIESIAACCPEQAITIRTDNAEQVSRP